MQMGGVYSTASQEEGLFLQEHRDRNGRCIGNIAILLKIIGVRA